MRFDLIIANGKAIVWKKEAALARNWIGKIIIFVSFHFSFSTNYSWTQFHFVNEIFRVLKIGCSAFDFNCPRIVRVELGIYSCVQPDDALSGHERPRDFIRVPIAIMDPQIRNVHVYALIVAHA